MRLFLRLAKALSLAVLLTTFAGCGGGGGGTPTPPAISVSLAPSAQTTIDQGQAVNFTATVAHDSSNQGVTWSVSGTACTGDACGTFTNTAATSATYNAPSPVTSNLTVSVKATSVSDTTKSASSTVVVTPPPGITITSLSDGTAGTAYSGTLQASGGAGTLTWSVISGTLPPGLSLNSSTGVISGTPSGAGSWTFTVQVTDSGSPALSAQQQLTITVNPATLTITIGSLSGGVAGTDYNATLQVSGGTPPITWSVTVGTLPDGLSLDSSTGAITGTPTTPGTWNFTVTATDAATPTPQTVDKQLSITISAAPVALTITTTSLSDGVVNTSYDATLTATGGTAPYTWSVTSGALPSWATLGSSTGAITGTPDATATTTFTVTVTDSSTPTAQTASKQLSITINAAATCGSGNESVLSGDYLFTLSGYDGNGYQAVVGTLTLDGAGNITDGYIAPVGVGIGTQGHIDASASSYSVGSDNRGCATIAYPLSQFSHTVRLSLGSISSGVATKGRVIEFANPSSSSYIAAGQIWKRDTTSYSTGLSGNFVMSMIGVDASQVSSAARYGLLGAFSAATGSLTAGEVDINDAGTTTHQPGVTGSYVYIGGDPANATGSYAVYMSNLPWGPYTDPSFTLFKISESEAAFTIGSNTNNGTPTVLGLLRMQTGTFSNSSLNGAAVFAVTRLAGSGAGGVTVGTFTGDGSGSGSVTAHDAEAGTVTSETFPCAYTVASNGRTTTSSCGSDPPVMYLTATNTAFLLSPNQGVSFGEAEPQAAGPFDAASVSGTFFMGTGAVASQDARTEVGSVTLDGAGGVSGISDGTTTTDQNANDSFTDTYTVNSDGTFMVGSSGTDIVGIVISGNKLVIISDPTSTNPTILLIEK